MSHTEFLFRRFCTPCQTLYFENSLKCVCEVLLLTQNMKTKISCRGELSQSLHTHSFSILPVIQKRCHLPKTNTSPRSSRSIPTAEAEVSHCLCSVPFPCNSILAGLPFKPSLNIPRYCYLSNNIVSIKIQFFVTVLIAITIATGFP